MSRTLNSARVTDRETESQTRCSDAIAPDELLLFPARYLAELPVPLRITLQLDGFAVQIHWSSELVCGPHNGVIFDSHEVRSIAVAVQAERLWPSDLKGYCLRKLQDPSFRVTDQLALEGAQPAPGPAWSLARILDQLELELVRAEWTEHASAASRPSPIGAAA
jgi:hypothetical protein